MGGGAAVAEKSTQNQHFGSFCANSAQ